MTDMKLLDLTTLARLQELRNTISTLSPEVASALKGNILRAGVDVLPGDVGLTSNPSEAEGALVGRTTFIGSRMALTEQHAMAA